MGEKTPLQEDFEAGGLHPRDVAFRTSIPFDRLMGMWRGDDPIDSQSSKSIARLTGRRFDFYSNDEDVHVDQR